MRSLSDLIANSKPVGDPKPAGPLAAALFVAVLLASATGVAYWIGSSISSTPEQPMVTATADFAF